MLTHTPENQRLVDLLQRVSLQDHAAFKQLYDLTSAHLYGVAMRFVRQRELADEILQDAFINVWQQAGSYAATLSTPMTWLITIVRNKSLDRLRKGKLESDNTSSFEDNSPDQYQEEVMEHADPHDLFAAATEKIEVTRCLSQLDAPQRQSLALAYYNGLSHSELAEQLQVPLGTAKAWIRRGLDRLKKCLEQASLAPQGK
ncbi:RNA polymerase sigma-70 factor, ECF subfamily [Duganella sp. CF517]|uniref:sigma-70 family RNA polymerase sigma factor n=1 Tax=Duganella sp. CF517 TaxID=1881038 RepID=UPI0008BB73D4|nr:sigma-70 family RNA polymerase sigma factor [Duganella sp. CF517]SEN08578.1 RNA polymerase sigma-70 factor, ECF subfamily [Duganella sp. CF517]